MLTNKLLLPDRDQALVGRDSAMILENKHYVNGNPIMEPFLPGGAVHELQLEQAVFGLGCFWGAERKFWNIEGVFSTAVGYSAGYTPNPSYEEVCTGKTGHNEVVLVVFDANKVSYQALLNTFFESHNPTQGMQQGNDRGTQYRSGIYYTSLEQKAQAERTLDNYQISLNQANHPKITTEIVSLTDFYYAEQYHQQYLAKNPNGYCGLGGTGVSCAI